MPDCLAIRSLAAISNKLTVTVTVTIFVPLSLRFTMNLHHAQYRLNANVYRILTQTPINYTCTLIAHFGQNNVLRA